MKVWVYNAGGEAWLLPESGQWDISHGFCSPCDSFELEFAAQPGMMQELERATEIKIEHGDRNVFRGRIDEISLAATGAGLRARLSGRGMQALLLDNEAESADYYNADLDFILSRHVRGQGIESIDTGGAAGTAALFTVESGTSHWGVLEEFARFCCGVRPRFSPEGVLIMDGEGTGDSLCIDSGTPFTEMEYREDRYGVISSIKVKQYSGGGEITVKNSQFAAAGGLCSRVVNVPRKTSYDRMRYTARYRLDRSMEDYRKLFVTLPWAFAAFPGDRVRLNSQALGMEGEFLVVLSRCRGGAGGESTRLEMRRI